MRRALYTWLHQCFLMPIFNRRARLLLSNRILLCSLCRIILLANYHRSSSVHNLFIAMTTPAFSQEMCLRKNPRTPDTLFEFADQIILACAMRYIYSNCYNAYQRMLYVRQDKQHSLSVCHCSVISLSLSLMTVLLSLFEICW